MLIDSYLVERFPLLLGISNFRGPIRPFPTIIVAGVAPDANSDLAAARKGWDVGASTQWVPSTPSRAEILVREGTFLVLSTIFYRMLANPNVLPEIGDAQLEMVTGPTLSDFFDNALSLAQEGPIDPGGELAPIFPECPKRRAYAEHLRTLALDIVLLHELAHVLNGHAAYREAVVRGAAREPTDDERAALEFDADMAAFQTSGELLRRLLAKRERGSGEQRMIECDSKTAALRDLAFVGHTIFELHQPLIRSGASLLHGIRPRERQAFMAAQLWTWAPDRLGIPEDECRSLVWEEGVAKAALAYKHVTGKRPDVDSIVEAHGNVAGLYTVGTDWETIRPEIAPYAFVKLAPARPPQG